ncbi:MAG: hypothetical protein U0T32_02050 [Chitinophagales bacterium]
MEIKADDKGLKSSRAYTFAEDKLVEPAYFELFKRKDIHISIYGNKKQHHAQVDYATEYFRGNDLLDMLR